MSRSSRLFLAALLGCGLVCGPVAPARAAEPDKLLPAETETVVYVNLKQVLASEVVKKFALDQVKQALEGQDVKKLLADMGLDPLKDVDSIWVGMSGPLPKKKGNDEKPADQEETKALIVVHGRFDPEKLFKAAEAAAKKDGETFSMIKEGGVVMFKYQPEDQNPIYATVVDEKTIVAGSDRKLVNTALKQAKEDKKSPVKAELADLLKPVDDKVSVFVAGLVKGKFDDLQIPAEVPLNLGALEKVLTKAETLTVAVRMTADVGVEVGFGMKDADAATDMADAVEKLLKDVTGLIQVAGAFDPKIKPLADVVKSATTDVNKKTVVIKVKLTGDVIGELLKQDGD
ncbi:MAG: hypothetical protein K2V38_25180 [Gemmataceae bacterium]|nr:hypothetical protein [Gemmataceae bacterium]